MSNIANRWEMIKTMFLFWFAELAIKWCGIEVLYWASPLEWKKYMSEGEPLTPEVYYQKEELC